MSDRQLLCPCCGSKMIEAVDHPRHLINVRMSPREKVLLDLFVAKWPRPLRRHSMVNALYGDDPNGGPLTADHTAGTVVTLLRKTLTPFGWTVRSNKGGRDHHGTYLLEQTPKFPNKTQK